MLVEKYVRISFARVQLVEIFSNYDAFDVGPRASADAAARVRGFVAVVGIMLGAQIGVPGPVAKADGARQLLANFIRAT